MTSPRKLITMILLSMAVLALLSCATLGKSWWEDNYMVPPGIVRSGSYDGAHRHITGGHINRNTNTWRSFGNLLAPFHEIDKRAAGRGFAQMAGLSAAACFNISYTHWEMMVNL